MAGLRRVVVPGFAPHFTGRKPRRERQLRTLGVAMGCLHRCWSARVRRNHGHLETAYTRRTRLHGHQPRRWSYNDGDRRIFRHMDSPRSWDCYGWNCDDRRCCPDDDDERQRAALVRARLPGLRPTGGISRWNSLPRQAYGRRRSGCSDGLSFVVWTHCILRDARSGRRRFCGSLGRRARRP